MNSGQYRDKMCPYFKEILTVSNIMCAYMFEKYESHVITYTYKQPM